VKLNILLLQSIVRIMAITNS